MEAGAELGFEIPPVHTSAPIFFHYSRFIPISDIPGLLKAGAPQHFLAFLRFVLALASLCPCLALLLLNLLMFVAFPHSVCATEASFQKDFSPELHLSDRAVLGSSWAVLGQSGAVLGCLGAVLGFLEAVLASSWDVLGCLGAILGCLELLEARPKSKSGDATLAPDIDFSEALFGRLEAVLGRLGAVLTRFGDVLGRLRAVWGRLGLSWGRLGIS